MTFHCVLSNEPLFNFMHKSLCTRGQSPLSHYNHAESFEIFPFFPRTDSISSNPIYMIKANLSKSFSMSALHSQKASIHHHCFIWSPAHQMHDCSALPNFWHTLLSLFSSLIHTRLFIWFSFSIFLFFFRCFCQSNLSSPFIGCSCLCFGFPLIE